MPWQRISVIPDPLQVRSYTVDTNTVSEELPVSVIGLLEAARDKAAGDMDFEVASLIRECLDEIICLKEGEPVWLRS